MNLVHVSIRSDRDSEIDNTKSILRAVTAKKKVNLPQWQQTRDSGYVPEYNLIRLQFECICLCSQVGDTPSTTSLRAHGPLCICSLQKLICFCPSGIG